MKRALPYAALLSLYAACSAAEQGVPVPVARECSIPVKEEVHQASKRGCWKMTSAPGHGFSLRDPGPVSCEDGLQCLIVLQGEPFWTLGAGANRYALVAVDCSEECP